MSRISSATLFNFTDNLDHLLDNLENGFYCGEIFEKLPLHDNGYSVPMTCFCDIPLSLISEHFNWYGSYGIGIKRPYARKLGVKPVWYVTSESQLVRNIVKSERTEYERKHLLPYLKQFLGNQLYKDGMEHRKKFYDEREWRYIPDSSLVTEYFGIKTALAKRNKKRTREFRMPIELKEIEYIIVEKDKDIDKLLFIIKKISKQHKFSYERLVSKIVTARQIQKDF